MSCGTLEMVLGNCDQLSSEMVRKWSHQISLGVEYLHRINIIHRDLKPGNIMITTKEVLKIGDFGISQVHTEHLPSTPLVTLLRTTRVSSADSIDMHLQLPIAHNTLPESP